MEEVVRDAVFGNVGTIIAFRIGAFDADFLENEFMPEFTPSDLVNLDKYNAYIKLMIEGITSPPFSMQTIPPGTENFGSREKVIRVSRERYSRPRQDVEEKIARWSGVVFQGEAEEEGRRQPPRQDRRDQRRPSPQPKNEELQDVVVAKTPEVITSLADTLNPPVRGGQRRDPSERRPRKSFPAVCTNCGKDTDVPFKPDPNKPVYCKECFEKIKKEKRELPAPPQGERGRSFRDALSATAQSTKKPTGFTGPQPPQPR